MYSRFRGCGRCQCSKLNYLYEVDITISGKHNESCLRGEVAANVGKPRENDGGWLLRRERGNNYNLSATPVLTWICRQQFVCTRWRMLTWQCFTFWDFSIDSGSWIRSRSLRSWRNTRKRSRTFLRLQPGSRLDPRPTTNSNWYVFKFEQCACIHDKTSMIINFS